MKPLPERPSPRWDPMKIYDRRTSAGPETTLPGGAPLLGPVYDEAPPGTSQPTMEPDEDLRPGDQRRPFPVLEHYIVPYTLEILVRHCEDSDPGLYALSEVLRNFGHLPTFCAFLASVP
eukprot:g61536.t1